MPATISPTWAVESGGSDLFRLASSPSAIRMVALTGSALSTGQVPRAMSVRFSGSAMGGPLFFGDGGERTGRRQARVGPGSGSVGPASGPLVDGEAHRPAVERDALDRVERGQAADHGIAPGVRRGGVLAQQ